MVLIDISPIEALKKIKENFLKNTLNYDLYDEFWNNANFDGKIKEIKMWYAKDNYENFLKNGNKNYGIDDITYHINEYGYRTSPDTNETFKENLISCFGCSQTFGAGLKWEDTWPYVLNQKMGEDWCVKNYALNGASNDMISRLIYNYTLKHKPKIICCLLPDVLRMELYDNNSQGYENFLPTDHDEIKKYNISKWEYYRSYRKLANEENGIYNFIKNYKFIDMLCEIKNIKLYWGTWSDVIFLSNNKFKEDILNIKNYITIDDDIEKNLDIARDGRHFGVNTNNEIANKFFKKIKNID
jgi:hypothetical protein